MSEQPYKRPPITEAVIEMRFDAPIDLSEIQKVSGDFAACYPHQQTIRAVEVAVGVPPALEQEPKALLNQQIGHRRSSTDLSEILLLWPATFVVSQLAPYAWMGQVFWPF